MYKLLTIDGAGRLVLPKPVRDELELSPGDTLELESAGEKITLRPVRATPSLTKEKGFWVFRGGEPPSASVTDEALKSVREERERDNRGMD